jgi:hypothetical protein
MRNDHDALLAIAAGLRSRPVVGRRPAAAMFIAAAQRDAAQRIVARYVAMYAAAALALVMVLAW